MSEEKKLLDAADRGDLDRIKELFQKKVNVNAKNEFGASSLHLAARRGDLEIVKYLTKECGAEVNQKDEILRTPLFYAVEGSHVKIVRYLVEECEAKLDEKADRGVSVLSYAAGESNLDILRYLVKECGMSVHEKDNEGKTVLFNSLWAEHLIVVIRFLVKECGANVDEKDENDETPLISAAKSPCSSEKTIRCLVKECDATVDMKDNRGRTALFYVAYQINLEKIRILVKECDANVDEKDQDGKTPLIFALQSSFINKETIWCLVKECGAKVDVKDNMGRTALSYEVEGGHFKMVQYLVEECAAKVDEKDCQGRTALSYAAVNWDLNLVRYLVKECGAKVDVKDNMGRTALFYAVACGNLENVQFLVKEGGANVGEKDLTRNTCLHLAARNGHLEVVRYLVEECGADVNVKDNMGRTPLSYEAGSGHLKMVRFLVEEVGAKVGEKSLSKHNSLHFAAENGHIEIVRYLIEECGAAVNEKDFLGKTALSLAAESGHLDVVQHLVGYEAKVDEMDLLYAARNAKIQLVAYLVFNKNLKVEKRLLRMPVQDGTRFFLECCYLSQSTKTIPELFQKLSKAHDLPTDFSFRLLIINLFARIYLTHKKYFPNDGHATVVSWLQEFSYDETDAVVRIAIAEKYFLILPEIKNYPKHSLELNAVSLDEEAIKAMEYFLKSNNSILHVLQFCKVEFTKKGYEKFLEFLGDKISRLEAVALDDCNLSNVEVQALARCLSSAIKLRGLNLNNNKITSAGFEYLIAGLSRELKELSLVNNFIDYQDVSSTYISLRALSTKKCLDTDICINLSGNLIQSNEHNPQVKKIIMWILMRADLSIEELLNCKFDKLYKKDDDYSVLQLSLNDKMWSIKLNRAETRLINEEKMSQRFSTDDEFFTFLFEMRVAILSMKSSFLAEKLCGKTEKEVGPARKVLLDYHPAAPLKSYIRVHSFFRSPQLHSVKSLLSPHLDITLDGWRVYVIAKKPSAKDVLTQHAWLAYEGLTKHGQRFLKVANLTTPVNGYWEQFKNLVKGGGIPTISFFVWNNSQLETVEYLKKNCIIAGFMATRAQVKKMHAEVEKDLDELPQRYKMIISSSHHPTQKDKNKELVNCVKWAVERLEECIGIKIPDECKGAFIPCEVVNNLVTLSKSYYELEKFRLFKH